MTRIFITGTAGFIGYHTALRLLGSGHEVLGYDSVNDYYDVRIKHSRLEQLGKNSSFSFKKGDLTDQRALADAYSQFRPDRVIHLAAQAGVRYSIENPRAYIDSNLVGFQNIIELVRHSKPDQFIYASSSSVYGGNTKLPFSESDTTINPISLYAATKMSNELVAKSYCNLYNIPAVGLRFFTVYGPYARPDMAIYKFAELMRQGKPIQVYNQGKMIRDWTYIDDIVDGILASLQKPESGEVYNLGKGSPDYLSDMIALLEEYLGIKANKEFLPIQMGDVEATNADISKARSRLGYEPKTQLKDGLKHFCAWYRDFYK
jgi:UDP-glucuronate 4-epimerase